MAVSHWNEMALASVGPGGNALRVSVKVHPALEILMLFAALTAVGRANQYGQQAPVLRPTAHQWFQRVKIQVNVAQEKCAAIAARLKASAPQPWHTARHVTQAVQSAAWICLAKCSHSLARIQVDAVLLRAAAHLVRLVSNSRGPMDAQHVSASHCLVVSLLETNRLPHALTIHALMRYNPYWVDMY